MEKSVLCLSALLFMVKAGTVPSATIYDTAIYDEGSKAYYRVHDEPATWLAAYTTCVEEGGRLAVVTNESSPFLVSNIAFPATRIFLGFGKWETGSWSTINDQSLNAGYENWAYGEPNNEGENQRCGTMYGNGEFDDFYCILPNPFICQIYSFPEGNTYYEGTKGYYRFHVKPATWLSAYTTCAEEGGHLAIINSQDEADFFVRNFPSNAESVFLGFNNWENGTWVTIHDQTLSEAGYEKWAPGEPNNGGASVEQRCGTMYRSGKLEDDYCNRKLPFICEKNAIEADTNGNKDFTIMAKENVSNEADPVNKEDLVKMTVKKPTEKQNGDSERLKVETSGTSSPQEVHFALSLVSLLRAQPPSTRLDAQIHILKYLKHVASG